MWEQRESNPRPSACKADALNQLSYAPDTRFFFAITASDFTFSLLTTGRLLRRSAFVFLVLTKNKLRLIFVFFAITASDFTKNKIRLGFKRTPRLKRDCKDRQHFLSCKFFSAFLQFFYSFYVFSVMRPRTTPGKTGCGARFRSLQAPLYSHRGSPTLSNRPQSSRKPDSLCS